MSRSDEFGTGMSGPVKGTAPRVGDMVDLGEHGHGQLWSPGGGPNMSLANYRLAIGSLQGRSFNVNPTDIKQLSAMKPKRSKLK